MAIAACQRDTQITRVHRSHTAPGFTIIELLVTVSIIALLVAITLPSLGHARESVRSTTCASNLHQMSVALRGYMVFSKQTFPLAYKFKPDVWESWEINTVVGPPQEHHPGTLWRGDGNIEISQCPSFDGPDNWSSAAYSGYNYNTSYLGHGQFETDPQPAKLFEVKKPKDCVVFGDGGWSGGANKFMRAPFPNPGDAGFNGRYSGTQAFRHFGGTNAMFVDGSHRRFDVIHTNTTPADAPNIAPGTGFISEDNSLYDLD